MNHRIRLAMQDDMSGGKLGFAGHQVEIDETFIGGKVRNMHKSRKVRAQRESQKGDKAIVLGMPERKGRVRATVIADCRKKSIELHVIANVAEGAEIATDELSAGWYGDQAIYPQGCEPRRSIR